MVYIQFDIPKNIFKIQHRKIEMNKICMGINYDMDLKITNEIVYTYYCNLKFFIFYYKIIYLKELQTIDFDYFILT